jgi:hypothetical protein
MNSYSLLMANLYTADNHCLQLVTLVYADSTAIEAGPASPNSQPYRLGALLALGQMVSWHESPLYAVFCGYTCVDYTA